MASIEQINDKLLAIELDEAEAGELAAILARRLGGTTYSTYSFMTQDGGRVVIGVVTKVKP
jgi:ribosomal protein L13